jgi:phospholipase/carboxylesterase
MRPVTINGGARMRAWYDIKTLSADDRADEDGLRESMREIDALLARERDRGVPPSRQLLVGFSMGGALALASGLRREAPVAGIAALSSYLPLASKLPAEMTPGGKATPVFMAHGTQDPVVVPAWGSRSRDALQALGVAVQWHTYPMPHSVCAEEVRDLGDWMAQRFAGNR